MAGFVMRILVTLLGLKMAATNDDLIKNKIDEHLMSYSVLYGLAATASVENSTSTCRSQLTSMANAIADRSRWAIKMMDASGMPKGGLHFGGTYWLGSRRQCQAAGVVKNIQVSPAIGPITIETTKDIPPFPIAYFAAYFQHDSNIQVITHMPHEFRMTMGLCLPKSCEESELTGLLQKYFDSEILIHQKLYNATYRMEKVKILFDDYSWLWQFKTITMGLIIGVAIVLCILGTIYDVNKYHQPMIQTMNGNLASGKNGDIADPKNICDEARKKYTPQVGLGYRIIKCFSMYSNNKMIFNTKTSRDAISVIHGMKFFSMLCIILGHSIISTQLFYDNKVNMFYISDEYIVQLLTVTHSSVDTYFCISGYLLAYSFFRSEYGTAKKKKYNVLERAGVLLVGILKRFLRLSPAYMITLGLNDVIATWRYKVTPYWFDERNDLTCSTYWWRNLLYISNLFPRSEMCLTWSWYLNNDMQYFIIVLFFLVLSTMYFKIAASLFTALFFGSIGYTVYLVYDSDFIPYIDALYLKSEAFYGNPLMRIGAYIVGVYAAYLVYYCKKQLPLQKNVIRLFWIISPILCLCTLFGLTDRDVSLAYSAAYMSIGRIIWAITIAWALIACETGNGGLFSKIFSCKYWYPLSRLTYVAYLLNSLVIFVLISYSDKAYQLELSNLVFMSPGFMVLTFMAAYIFTLLFESPNIALNKIFFDYLKSKKKVNVVTSKATSNRGFEFNEDSKAPEEVLCNK